MPFKIHEDTNPYDNPVRDIRDQGVVVTTLFRNPAKKNNQTKQEPNGSRNNNSTNSDPSKDQIETRTTTAATVLTSTASQNFPKPTVSPTKDPYYIYREAAQIVGKRNPNAGISSEYLLRDNVAATEKPKMKNAFDEGRYEFKPSRFRQTEPILLSGSSLFGNGEPTKSARQAGGSGYPQPVNLENILIRSKNTSRTLNGSAVYLYWAILPIPTKVCSHQEMPSISGHQALVGLALISAKAILLHRFRISFHLLRPHLLPRHLMVQAQRQLQLPVKLYFDFRFSSKFEKQDQRTDLVKFHHFGKSLQVLGNFLTVFFLFGKMLSLLWQICDLIGLFFHVANGQILKNNLTIWSHYSSYISC